MKHIYILGSGAMGSLWASYFHPQDQLHFIRRNNQHNEYAFTIEPEDKRITGTSLMAHEITSPIDFLVLATKAYDALTALNSVKTHLAKYAHVILLQNGLGAQQAIQAQFTDLRLYACSSTEGAYKTDANTLVHAGKGINTIGPMNQHASSEHLQQWLDAENYIWQDNIEQTLWRKFMINCAINPLTAVYNCKNGELINQPHYLNHMQYICEEINRVTQVKYGDFDDAFALAQHVCNTTADNISSMLQDTRNTNPTELNYMTGYLLKIAESLGISCPYNQAIYKQLQRD